MSHEAVIKLQSTEKQNLGCSINHERVSETVIGIPEDSQVVSSSEESGIVRDYDKRSGNSEESKVLGDKDEKKSSVDVKKGDEEINDSGRICRICHLNSEQPWKLAIFETKMDLIQIGCGCKGELSIAHSSCAEAWFKLKGNRICEICGEMADNIKGVANERFMEEWKDSCHINSGSGEGSDGSSGGGAERCWNGQPLCNLLMACLVIAFVLPWFFRINMF